MTDPIPSIGNSTPTGPLLPEAFDQFVGDTFFRQMLKSMRSGTGKPAFLHGGQAEEIFQSQLDELMITDLVKATKDSFSADLFKQQFPDPTLNTPPVGATEDPHATKPVPHTPTRQSSETTNFDANA